LAVTVVASPVQYVDHGSYQAGDIRKCYLEPEGWTYLLRRQGPDGTVEFKIGRTVNLEP
jgi:hypothetical protein